MPKHVETIRDLNYSDFKIFKCVNKYKKNNYYIFKYLTIQGLEATKH